MYRYAIHGQAFSKEAIQSPNHQAITVTEPGLYIVPLKVMRLRLGAQDSMFTVSVSLAVNVSKQWMFASRAACLRAEAIMLAGRYTYQ